MHPSYAIINLSNLKRNFLNIRKKVKDKKIMAVVKAEAYGHGMVECSKFLELLGEKGPDYYSVAFPKEGEKLRKAKIRQPILIFEPFSKRQVNLMFKYNLIPTVFNQNHIKILEWGYKNYYSNKKSGPKIKIHIKVDTGMNRLGINDKDALDFILKVKEKNIFQVDGIYTHFASSDEKDKSFTYMQINKFKKVLNDLKNLGVNYGLVHAANSGAILDIPESYFDMVRPGLLLYGYYPSLETSKSIKLQSVMSLYSRVASVKELKKGDTVSYGRKFTAKKNTNIISVPLGYADGVNRNLSNNMEVIIKNKKYKQVGTITMDRFMVDIKNSKIKVDDKVVMLGKVKNNYISAWDWSNALNTIPYEITCNIGHRIPRIYKK